MNRWFHFKFRFGLPQRWWIDLFLIDQLFRDILTKKRNELKLWRFHRRAAPGDAGHQLSFLCYTNDDTAESIEQIIADHISVNILRENKILKDYLRDEYDSRIEATSDGNWPSSIQKSWPYFIMGVCEMFVDLIIQHRSLDISITGSNDISEIEKLYSDLHESISAVWEDEGSHAFLHHLNAIFGYEPLVPKPRWSDNHRVIF